MSEIIHPHLPTNPDWDPTAETQPIRVVKRSRSKRRFSAIFWGFLIGLTLSIYLFFPARSNILILGIDRTPPGTVLGRTDTMILTTIRPLDAYVGMLSIPRDLWVQLPDGQHNRINTAHFFAESLDPGSGQEAAKEVVQLNFGIDVHYYVRFQFEQLISFVNALGGILIDLEEPIAGYPPGEHLLNGEQALAFVRDRMGTDDFFRMSHAQLFIQALVKQIMQPRIWMQAPGAIIELMSSLDTDIPIWLWPRLGISILRVGFDGLDLRVISREMVSGFLTENGAQVLAPDWSRINPVLMEMFGQ